MGRIECRQKSKSSFQDLDPLSCGCTSGLAPIPSAAWDRRVRLSHASTPEPSQASADRLAKAARARAGGSRSTRCRSQPGAGQADARFSAERRCPRASAARSEPGVPIVAYLRTLMTHLAREIFGDFGTKVSVAASYSSARPRSADAVRRYCARSGPGQRLRQRGNPAGTLFSRNCRL